MRMEEDLSAENHVGRGYTDHYDRYDALGFLICRIRERRRIRYAACRPAICRRGSFIRKAHDSLSTQQQKHRRPLVQLGLLDTLPLHDRVGADELGRQCQVDGHAEERRGGKDLQGSLQHIGIAVGGFDEELSFTGTGRLVFQSLEVLGQVRAFGAEVTMEGKPLPVQAGGHQGE